VPEFTDANGKTWVVRLDAPTIADVRAETCSLEKCNHRPKAIQDGGQVCDGIDLAELEGRVANELENDPVKLVNVLWLVCREQAVKDSISDQQFGRALVGDPIGHATKALTDAITDFFPSGKRTLLRSLVEKQGEIRDKGTALALAKINNPELEAQLLKAMEAKMDAEIANMLTQLSSATAGRERAG
jgi:hypothetical protein